MIEVFSNSFFVYFLIPLLILISRIIDVSLGTLRIILANKGIKLYSAVIAFFEVLIWLLVITTIIKNLDNVAAYIAYCLGYALGTYFGVCLDEKISFGYIKLRIITKKNLAKMIEDLRPTKYVFISNSVNSSHGKIKIINAFLERKYLKKVIKRVKDRDPNAFYTIEDLKMIKEEPKEKRHFFITNKSK
ncbi:MAG: DUF5698 domain-containing protein [Candidatus Nanoarchaeia archaeon]|nr:DUF5698 domain-containing protein [Candidatus Nanoarchaeia archaeon]